MSPSPAGAYDAAPKIAESKKPRKDRTHWLYIAVIIAIIAGIALGMVAPRWR